MSKEKKNYQSKYPSYLPKQSDKKYFDIENFIDYQYTNNIAYEMMIRTKEYKELIGVSLSNRDEKWEDAVLELGIDPILVKNTFNINLNFFDFLYPSSQSLHTDFNSFVIRDIPNGLEKLIEFYIKKNKIYSLKDYTHLLEKNKKNKKNFVKTILKNIDPNKWILEENLTLNEVLQNKKQYFIPCLFEQITYYSTEIKEVMCEINEYISIYTLEQEFLNEIRDLIPLYRNKKIINCFTRPILRFKESMFVDITLNLDLPSEELTKYVEKLKAEYSTNSRNVKNLYEIITNQKFNKEKHKPIDNKKKVIADAFFCYDYYKAKKEYIENINKIIADKNNNNSMLQELNEELERIRKEDVYDKTKKINDIKEQIKKETKKSKPLPTINKRSKNYIFDEAEFKSSDINKNTAYFYYGLIKNYIDDLEYRKLICSAKS